MRGLAAGFAWAAAEVGVGFLGISMGCKLNLKLIRDLRPQAHTHTYFHTRTAYGGTRRAVYHMPKALGQIRLET